MIGVPVRANITGFGRAAIAGLRETKESLPTEYRITITDDAEVQFLLLPVRDRRSLQAAIGSRLRHQPTILTRAVKRLRENPVAEFELRVGDFRVLYNVEVDEVVVVVVGRKVGNKLILARGGVPWTSRPFP